MDTVRCLMSLLKWECHASALIDGCAGSATKALPACLIGPHDRIDARATRGLSWRMR